MKLHRAGLLLCAAVSVALLLISNQGVYCMLQDSESVAGGSYTAYVPVQWKQTDQADFALGTTFMTSVTASPGNVVLGYAPSIAPSVLALSGGGTSLLYVYVASTDRWSSGTNTPAAVSDGGGIVSDGQRFAYAFQGGSSAFWRYDASLDSWSTLAAAPGTVSAGSDLTYSMGKVYALQGGGSSAVWVYDILGDSWAVVPISGTLYGMSGGSSICIAGGYLYCLRPSTPYMIRMPASGGAWSASTADITQPTTKPGLGSDIEAVSSNSLTVLFGGGVKTFRSYTISSKTWSNLGNTPSAVNVGGGLTYQPANTVLSGTSYFALAGGSSKTFWKFTISNSRWTAMSSIPTGVAAGGGLTYLYSAANQYSVSGSFISVVKDTGKSGRLMNTIVWDATIPSNANQQISIKVRASDTLMGGAPNAAWTLLSTQNAVSGTSTYYASLSGMSGQYVQYKVEMITSDVTASPLLSETRLYYASY